MAWVAAIAAIASAAIGANAQNQAAKRQKQLAVEAQQRQLNAQNQATDVAMKRVQEFDPNIRKTNQEQIQQELTAELDQQVSQPQITAQGVQVGSTIPESAGSKDYLTAKAREAAKTTASLRGLAALMGRIGSAGDLRRGEAVGIGDTAGAVGRIQTGAGNIFAADQAGINSVQPNTGAMLASAALRAYGAAGAPGMGGSASATPTTGTFARMDRGQANWL
jgi:hypothetical protein